MPAAGKLIELEYAGIEDRKVRSQLRSATDLEVKVRFLSCQGDDFFVSG